MSHDSTSFPQFTSVTRRKFVRRREENLAKKLVFNRRVAKDIGGFKGEVSLLQVFFVSVTHLIVSVTHQQLDLESGIRRGDDTVKFYD